MTVVVERVPGDPVPTVPPPALEDDDGDDSPEAAEEHQAEPTASPDVAEGTQETSPAATTPYAGSTPLDESSTSTPSLPESERSSTTAATAAAPSETPGQPLLGRRKRDLDDADSSSPVGAIG